MTAGELWQVVNVCVAAIVILLTVAAFVLAGGFVASVLVTMFQGDDGRWPTVRLPADGSYPLHQTPVQHMEG